MLLKLGVRCSCFVAAGLNLSTPTYPILLVPCQMSKHGRLGKALALHGCYLRRFEQQGANKIGSVSWPESGFFCLLFLAVEEKYGRAEGRGLKKPHGCG